MHSRATDTPDPDTVLDIEAAKVIADCSRDTVKRAIDSGLLAAGWEFGRRVVRLSDLLAWNEARRLRPRSRRGEQSANGTPSAA